MVSGIYVKGAKSKKGNQPPKKRIVVTEDIKIILLYSAKKNKANPIAEYSTLYPDTSSASASGKSKGCLFVSANAHIKNNMKTGKRGKANQTPFWVDTISEKFNVRATTKTERTTAPKEISYEIIWAAERSPPKKAYLELLDHPAIITVCTPKEESINTYKRLNLKSVSKAPSPNGITIQLAKASPKVKIGAKMKIIPLELLGIIDSLSKSFNPSAIGCKRP